MTFSRTRIVLNAFIWAFLLSKSEVLAKTVDNIPVRLGDTSIDIIITEQLPRSVTFISLHENETTAVVAVTRLIESQGGRLLQIRAQGQRLITFRLMNIDYVFDPNRIFSDYGLEKTLRHYGDYSESAHEAVVKLRDTILGLLSQDLLPPVAAVHNNSNEEPLSVANYATGGSLEREARYVFINHEHDPDDFFLVTELGCFKTLAGSGFNTVLQRNDPTDDGSLSVYFQQKQVSYINIEAQHGHLTEQFAMLKAAFDARTSCSK